MPQIVSYLNPFLKSHSFHMVVGPDRVGKTTYVLQMLSEDGPREHGAADPWGDFSRGTSPVEAIWYVDLIKPRPAVLARVAALGMSIPDPSRRRLKIVTRSEIVNARLESTRDLEVSPITFEEVLKFIMTRNHGSLPAILIIDGFSLLIQTKRDKEAGSEINWFSTIDELYLSRGGCLIGIQTAPKANRIPGVSTMGTYALSGASGGVTEILYAPKGHSEGRRSIRITGNDFPVILMNLEQGPSGGRFIVPAIGTLMVSGEITDIAIELSLKHKSKWFSSTDLVLAAKGTASRASVFRWLKKQVQSGTAIQVGDGWYVLNPAPQKRSVS